MNTGNMRNKVVIYRAIETQNEVGEIIKTKELFLSLMAEVNFDRTVDSSSKFDRAWNNRLIIRTRYANSLMELINSRDGFLFEYQDKTYNLVNYEMWNQTQRFITFYVETCNDGKV